MNAAGYAIKHKAVTLVFTVLIAFAGFHSYENLGRLEDPEFTIKVAVIMAQYPGATALQVEEEVTEPLESAIQQLKQLDEVRSISRAGMSIIYAEMKDIYAKDTLPQVWDELRRKVGAVRLPPGCESPVINDDFGDVYGIFYAITGDGYSHSELREVSKDLRRELLLCRNVGRIEFWGVQQEMIYVEMDRVRLSAMGLSPGTIFDTINQQNSVAPAGKVQVGPEYQSIRLSGQFNSVRELEELLIAETAEGRMIRLKDVARIRQGLIDPPVDALRYDGMEAIGLGISTVAGGNVVVMGDSVKERLAELESQLPLGVELHPIAFQSDTVEQAVNGFVLNLLEAVIIVIILLMVFMGWREGLIIGIILLVTILATFIGMKLFDINLQRISLGALIIALGMLVDNAIVVAEGIVVKRHQGLSKLKAAEDAVRETQWPLLGATVIAILAFAAISISRDVTGEFLGSLFKVIALALGLSWVFAISITPYLCDKLLPENPDTESEMYQSWFYRIYRSLLQRCLRHRTVTLVLVLAMFIASLSGFKLISKNFFPNSTRPQFTVDIWLPEGTHIATTQDTLETIRKKISTMEGVTHSTTFAGRGGLRFVLPYEPEMPSSAYGQLLVDVDDFRKLEILIPGIAKYLNNNHPGMVHEVKAFRLGPGGAAIEARFSGPDSGVLRELAGEAKSIMWQHPNTRTVKTNWGDRVKTVDIAMSEARARELGVSRMDIASSLQMSFSGITGGIYRLGDELLPIMLRLPEEQREGVDQLYNAQVWNMTHGKMLPIDQVSDEIRNGWEDPVIHRRDRKRTLTVGCAPVTGTADSLLGELKSSVESITLPDGYTMEWGGEYEHSTEANQKLMANVPLAFMLMFLISVMLFNTLRHPVIIFLGLPLALIGVTWGLYFSGQPFGFMATLGFLSLSGMLIKNEIVLLDQINLDLKAGKKPFQAVVDSAVSRVRPVCMATFTTVLGMIPLLWDVFFAAMAVTIMAGLSFATLLTLIVIPVLYGTFFQVKPS